MKNIKKTLEEQKSQVEEQFNKLEQKRKQLVAEQQTVVTEQIGLQGEYRKLLQLLEDFKDEPQEK